MTALSAGCFILAAIATPAWFSLMAGLASSRLALTVVFCLTWLSSWDSILRTGDFRRESAAVTACTAGIIILAFTRRRLRDCRDLLETGRVIAITARDDLDSGVHDERLLTLSECHGGVMAAGGVAVISRTGFLFPRWVWAAGLASPGGESARAFYGIRFFTRPSPRNLRVITLLEREPRSAGFRCREAFPLDWDAGELTGFSH